MDSGGLSRGAGIVTLLSHFSLFSSGNLAFNPRSCSGHGMSVLVALKSVYIFRYIRPHDDTLSSPCCSYHRNIPLDLTSIHTSPLPTLRQMPVSEIQENTTEGLGMSRTSPLSTPRRTLVVRLYSAAWHFRCHHMV